MKKILQNSNGSSLVAVLVIGSILVTSGMYLLKETQNSQKRQIHIEYKIQENQIEDTLVHTLSSKDFCKNIFNTYVKSDSNKLVFDNDKKLKDKIKSETKSLSNFSNLDYQIEAITNNNDFKLNDAKKIESGSATLKVKVIRDSKLMSFNGGKNSNVLNLEIPIFFEFDIDNGNRKLMSCYARSRDTDFTDPTRHNCESFGGTLDNNQKCIFKSNELVWDSNKEKFEVKARNDQDLQDMLCAIDNSVTQKIKTTNLNDLYSEFCPKVQFNGCIVEGKKYSNGDTIKYSYQGKKRDVYHRANLLVYQASYLRYLKYSTDFELAGLDFSAADLDGTYVRQKSVSKSALVTGAIGSTIVAGILGTGLLTPLVMIKMEEWICGNKHKGNVTSQCVDGREVVTEVIVQKRGMKKFKCKWKSAGNVYAESEGQIMLNLLNLIDGNKNVQLTPTYGSDIGESPDQTFKDTSEFKKSFDDEITRIAAISDFDSFYSEIKEFNTTSSEKLSANDKEGIPPAILEIDLHIDKEIRKNEIIKWDQLRDSIKTYAFASQDYKDVSDFIYQKTSSISYGESHLVIATPAETSILAKKDMMNLHENIITKIEERINSAKDLHELQSYGNPSVLRGALDSKFNYRLNTIINTYNTKQKDFQPKPTT